MPVSTLSMFSETARTYLTMRIGEITLDPPYTAILIAALAAALLSAFKLWLIGKQEERQARLDALRATVGQPSGAAKPRGPQWYQWLGRLLAISPMVGKSEQQRLLAALAAAGIRKRGSLAIFITTKLCSALGLAALFWAFIEWEELFQGYTIFLVAVLITGLMLGWRLPEIILSRMAARRRIRIEQGLPDALDLLVICAEAGLSLDQAIDEVAGDLSAASPVMAEELALTSAEMRVLADRGQALQNLVTRTGVKSLYGVVATLTQAIRFGTPLADSMRVIALELRNERLARIEERAARLPVLLAMPLMAFILPALLMVLGTPVMLRIVDFLGNMAMPTFGAP